MIQHLAIFQQKQIRKTMYNNQWWFVIEDVVFALTDSSDPKQYIQKIKQRDLELSKGWVQIVHTLEIETKGGKQKMICSSTEGIFRIIQSIPSPKAEPFKKWLAKVGYERIQEIEDPELASKRTREIYIAKGYSDAWIEKRIRGIAIRDELTGQWKKRGVQENIEFSILTAQISQATFGMTPNEYKKYEGLKNSNLRDHFTDLELIFSMLGESATTEITQAKDSQGFNNLKEDAFEGGKIAEDAKKALEKKIDQKVSTKKNFLKEKQKKKLLNS
ncbi:MAG: Bro-N domain-containing protein [bacterium]